MTHPCIDIVEDSLYFPGSAGPDGSNGPGELTYPEEIAPSGYFFVSNFGLNVVPEPCSLLWLCCGCAPIVLGRESNKTDRPATGLGKEKP